MKLSSGLCLCGGGQRSQNKRDALPGGKAVTFLAQLELIRFKELPAIQPNEFDEIEIAREWVAFEKRGEPRPLWHGHPLGQV